MKNITIILDPAHGEDVAGKRSPDGEHREYLWSRKRCVSLKRILIALGYEVYETTISNKEPGLSKRKLAADKVKTKGKKLLLSLHNNAAGMGDKWYNATGASVWTSKNVTQSDVCADFIIEQFKQDFPDVKVRFNEQRESYKDFESNFTVLMGVTYMAVLIEWLFQDCTSDVKKLQDTAMNDRFEQSLVKAIEKINNHFSK